MTAKLWDVTTFRELLTFRDHRGRVLGAAWSGDGKSIATVGIEGALKLRRADSNLAVDVQGDEWITLFEDNFDRDQPGPAWEKSGKNWTIEEGRLVGTLVDVPVGGAIMPAAFARLAGFDLPTTVDVSVDVRQDAAARDTATARSRSRTRRIYNTLLQRV
jgi:hypothetical protein